MTRHSTKGIRLIPFLALCAYFTIRFPLSPEKIKDLR